MTPRTAAIIYLSVYAASIAAVGYFVGALAASAVALGFTLIIAFRSNAAQAGLRALKYRRLETRIKRGLRRRTADDQALVGAIVQADYHDAPPDPHAPRPGFRVAGLSFDRDARASERSYRQNNVRQRKD